MKRISILAVFTAALVAAPAQSPDVQFRAAQQKETVEGDLNAAIAIYRKLADERATPPDVAARALVRLGRCYQRMGNTEARKAFERVLSQFSGQPAAVAEAKQLLASMDRGGRPDEGSIVVRKLQPGVQGIDLLSALIVSRDARYAAAVVAGRREVELVNLTNGQRTSVRTHEALASGNEVIHGAAISPDGQRIAVAVPTGINSSELRLIDRITGSVRTVFKSDTAFRVFLRDWSRDGRTILLQAATRGGLLWIDVDSGTARAVPLPGENQDAPILSAARLSPDGQFIAYMTRAGQFDVAGKILIQRLDGSGGQLIADPDGGANLAGWSLDGRFVLYTSGDLGTEHLWAIRVEDGRPTGEAVSLAKGFPGGGMAIAANGSLMVMIPGAARCYIAAIDAATGAAGLPKEVNARLNAQILSATWSPDGARMVYGARRNPSSEDVYIRDERTAEEHKLGTFPLIPRKMNWTPDGKALIMPQFARGGGSAVFRYSLADGKMDELIPAKDREPIAKAHPKLSADGRTVFYLEGSPAFSRLIRYDLPSGTAVPIATADSTYDLSPDSEQLVIPFVDTTSKTAGLRIINRNGQPVRDVVRLKPDERIAVVAWSPDGQWIYFGRGSDRAIEIDRVSVTGGNPTSTGLRTSGFPDLAVHPSGKQLIYMDRAPSELWRVDGIEGALARVQ
jgi:Tol biopolymer transport system component